MNPTSRALLLSAGLLVAFLTAALLLQTWLQRRTAAVQTEITHVAAERVITAIALAPRAPETWDDDYRAQLAAIGGGTVQAVRTTDPASTSSEYLGFERPLPGHPDWLIRGQIPTPALDRLQLTYQRALVALLLLGVLLGLVPLVVLLFSSRREQGARAPWQAEAAGFEQFARLTVERGVALEREHGARVRAEEDLVVSRNLLDRSLEERVRLGRELHDNISQTLYAVSLTLESVKKNPGATPVNEQRLDQSVQELRRLNREVRAFIRDLEPDNVLRDPFPAALRAVLQGVVPDDVQIDQRLDDEALALLAPQHTADIINIVREAVSNSVRHGHARHISVRTAHDGSAVVLAIADDGEGFAAISRQTGGHGLANMRARAAALGGQLQVDSATGKGTRVLLTIPVASREP